MNKEQTLEFLSKAADLHASDIFIIAGRPLSIKTDGRLSTYGDRLMPEQTSEILEAIYQMANNRDISRLHNTGDDDFSFSIPGLSRFRINAYKQRGNPVLFFLLCLLIRFDIGLKDNPTKWKNTSRRYRKLIDTHRQEILCQSLIRTQFTADTAPDTCLVSILNGHLNHTKDCRMVGIKKLVKF